MNDTDFIKYRPTSELKEFYPLVNDEAKKVIIEELEKRKVESIFKISSEILS